MDWKLRVIPFEEARADSVTLQIGYDSGKPVWSGPYGDRQYCGKCGYLLFDGITPEQVDNVIVRCSCGAVNTTEMPIELTR